MADSILTFTPEVVKDVEMALLAKVPYVHVRLSSLGGPGRATLMITFSLEPKDKWSNGILQNSNYSHISITQDGVVENFSGYNAKMRKFRVTELSDAIKKIGVYIDKLQQGKTAKSRIGMITSHIIFAEHDVTSISLDGFGLGDCEGWYVPKGKMMLTYGCDRNEAFMQNCIHRAGFISSIGQSPDFESLMKGLHNVCGGDTTNMNMEDLRNRCGWLSFTTANGSVRIRASSVSQDSILLASLLFPYAESFEFTSPQLKFYYDQPTFAGIMQRMTAQSRLGELTKKIAMSIME